MDKVEDLLTRAVDKIYPSKEGLKNQALKRKLRVYQGFDPTSPQLHIGHMVGLRKLRQWQELGHEVIFLIGDFTATIGDPTDKDSPRKPLTREQVLNNAKTYKEQASRILRFDGQNPVRIKFNSEWHSKISAQELLKIAGNITHSQLIERDMFQNRFKKEKDVYLTELLYPLMQAYDCVFMDVDVEVGATDQTFNMLMGRKLMRNLKKKEKYVMTTPLLTVNGEKKMGKTEGNVIALTDEPSDLFTKIMALGDDVIVKGFEYLTDLPMDEVKQIAEDQRGGKNPITYKKKLAFEIVKQLNDHESAHKAQEDFGKAVQNKELPASMPTISLPQTFISNASVAQGTIKMGLASSNSEVKRLIDQRGLKYNNEVPSDLQDPLSNYIDTAGTVVQRGPKKVRIEIK